jgi:nucleoside-diphosphate-sugar epimerase
MTGQRLTAHVATALADSRHRIIITGAGGWLGMATLELLADALGQDFGTRVVCFGASARPLSLRNGLTIVQRPLAAISALSSTPSFVLHLAFLTKDKVGTMDDARYAKANKALSAMVLQALPFIGARGVFLASSGAATRAGDPSAPHALRRYGELKAADEAAFAAWSGSHASTAIITRIFNLAGPYINKHAHYALANFINEALAGKPIVVRAPHEVWRGFVAIKELMSLVFAMLLTEDPGVARFDTGGAPQELGELAQEVADILGSPGFVRGPVTSDTVDRYCGNGAAYDALLLQHGISRVLAHEYIRDTAAGLAATHAAPVRHAA